MPIMLNIQHLHQSYAYLTSSTPQIALQIPLNRDHNARSRGTWGGSSMSPKQGAQTTGPCFEAYNGNPWNRSQLPGQPAGASRRTAFRAGGLSKGSEKTPPKAQGSYILVLSSKEGGSPETMVCRILIFKSHVLYTTYSRPYTIYHIRLLMFAWSSGPLVKDFR